MSEDLDYRDSFLKFQQENIKLEQENKQLKQKLEEETIWHDEAEQTLSKIEELWKNKPDKWVESMYDMFSSTQE